MNNFLSIVWYRVLPPQYGGQKGIAHFNYYLGKKIPLTCLCSRNNVDDGSLTYKVIRDLPVSTLQFWNPLVKKQILSLIRNRSFTHIIIEHPWHGWLGKYKKRYGFRLIVHAHNIEHLRLKEKNKLAWPVLKKIERKAFALADHILFKTEKDKQTAVKLFTISPTKCFIVPYGIEAMRQPVSNNEIRDRLRKKHNIAEEKIILFAGTLNYGPNATAMEAITHHIIPLLQKRKFRFLLLICGALAEKRISQLNTIPGVTATGFVDSIQEYMRSADVFINPVINGSGIQTKNIEAIANGCNVVATTFAASGLPGYLIDKKLFVSPDNDWELFTDNIIAASSLRNHTPLQFYNEYNWENTIDRLLPQIVSGE